MQRLATLVAALVSATLAAGMVLGTPLARADAEVYEACRGSEERIVAAELPETVDLDRCPVDGRVITDGGVGSVLPDPGEGVYAEVLTTSGAQELGITRYRDGTVELDHVGDDSEDATPEPAFDAAARRLRQGACRDRAYTDGAGRVEDTLTWLFNRATVPDELTPDAAEGAIRRAGTNVADTRSNCRLGDRVPVGLSYGGNTSSQADVLTDSCSSNDAKSEVSFGDLANGYLAVTCNWRGSGLPYKPILESDIKINKTDFNWTTRPDARSCRNRFDLEGVMTHERGHTFGLGHVAEDAHGALTMSTFINGSCQSSERTLGRGDVRGLGHKYKQF